jgi:hypothetical protein
MAGHVPAILFLQQFIPPQAVIPAKGGIQLSKCSDADSGGPAFAGVLEKE